MGFFPSLQNSLTSTTATAEVTAADLDAFASRPLKALVEKWNPRLRHVVRKIYESFGPNKQTAGDRFFRGVFVP